MITLFIIWGILYTSDIIAIHHLTKEEIMKSMDFTFIPGYEKYILLKRKLTK